MYSLNCKTVSQAAHASARLSILALTISGALFAPLNVGAEESEVIGERPQPFTTAPSVKPNVMSALAVENARSAHVLSDPSLSTTPVEEQGAVASDDVPWVLGSTQHPWPLRYWEPAPLNVLYLQVPTEAESRMMLPGLAADAANKARFTVGKYISDTLGASAALRGRQQEMLNSWIAKTEEQWRTVGADPWARYQFTLEARRHVTQFRQSVEAQTQPGFDQLERDIRQAVTRISPLIDRMPTYELRMAWYNVLVQLKDGASLYSGQIYTADQQLLKTMDGFLKMMPQAPRPAGNAPTLESTQKTLTPVPPQLMQTAPDAVTPEQKVPAKPIPADAPSGLTGQVIIGFGFLAMVGWFFLKLRNRKKKGGAAEIPKV